MTPWVVFPSADVRRGEKCTWAWRDMGYKVLVAIDPGKPKPDADIVMEMEFKGYYRGINAICSKAFELGADTVTAIGDDIIPDMRHDGEMIAKEFFKKFPDGCGVLQATGDMQGVDSSGVQAAARICGSPTFGKEYHRRANGGKGAFHDGYGSYYGDEELWNVASRQGLLWLEQGYTFLHRHWSFGHGAQTAYQARNSDQYWLSDKALFIQRQLRSFPGSEMIT